MLQVNKSSREVGSAPKGGEGMTENQMLLVMIGFGSLIVAIIFGVMATVIGILNLLKQK
jgi:hypothetical protein